MDLPTEKTHKAMKSLQRALDNLEKENLLGVIGDINYAKDSCDEIVHLIIAEIENSKIN